MKLRGPIPIIDLFAGPGGFGEGFSSATFAGGGKAFEIRLSIECDFFAHRTLELRSFFRKFGCRRVPEAYYDYLRHAGESEQARRRGLYAKFPDEAERASEEAWLAVLGKEDPLRVHARIVQALGNTADWVLIGGPPCQAYSLVGRARNRGNPKYIAAKDPRQTLYLEYIQVLADHLPSVFVMENVKGLLSATLDDQLIFEKIVEDLQSPCTALARAGRRVLSRTRGREVPRRYHVVSLVDRTLSDDQDLRRFVVRMENHGIPQTRHRVILLGVREDLYPLRIGVLPNHTRVASADVIDGLPRLRSGLSRQDDNFDAWLEVLLKLFERAWYAKLASADGNLHAEFIRTRTRLRQPRSDRGAEFIHCEPACDYEPTWFLDKRMGGICNHSARAHIAEDLGRYLYASCFAKAFGHSPTLREFPHELLPRHQNARYALEGNLFADRFRVQMRDRPATTITSHIAKDGHYYIHYDPAQCRSLTVREAARIQTFPDNYFFCGPRTSQYVQVGNAVPPLLAAQIAEIVKAIFVGAGLASRHG